MSGIVVSKLNTEILFDAFIQERNPEPLEVIEIVFTRELIQEVFNGYWKVILSNLSFPIDLPPVLKEIVNRISFDL